VAGGGMTGQISGNSQKKQTVRMGTARGTYEIRVRDHLDPCWLEWFEGWTVTNLENGEVLLYCANADQSALHGVLNKIRDLNLRLLSVAQVKGRICASEDDQSSTL
jgi:hypothetical protein